MIAALTSSPAAGWMGFTCRVENNVTGPAGTYPVESYRNGHFYGGGDLVVPFSGSNILLRPRETYAIRVSGQQVGRFQCPGLTEPSAGNPGFTFAENPNDPMAPTFALVGFEPNEVVDVDINYYGGFRWQWGTQTVDENGTLTLGTVSSSCGAMPLYIRATRADGSTVYSNVFAPKSCGLDV